MKYCIVGLPDSAIRESYQRIDAALRNSGFKMPRQKIVVNLAPADVKKEGTSYDLSIACGILAASGQIDPSFFEGLQIMGELSLDGTLKPVRGVLPLAILAKARNRRGFMLPLGNAAEARAVDGLEVRALENLAGLHRLSSPAESDREPIPELIKEPAPDTEGKDAEPAGSILPDFKDIMGQEGAKRALEIAVAGGHNILLVGPPGSGKTMLARASQNLFPALGYDECLEVNAIHSVAGLLSSRGPADQPPCRAPHHTISAVAMAGGGPELRPGEISLAHRGLLFLDELPEFSRSALEVLRQPMEEGCIRITRSRQTIEYPARFLLAAAMNPCPCGNRGHPGKICTCAQSQLGRYLDRVSGPLLDRIDIQLQVGPVSFSQLRSRRSPESTAEIRSRVAGCRQIQIKRAGRLNSALGIKHLDEFCRPGKEAEAILSMAVNRLNLSARAVHKILRMARTIADLEGGDELKPAHVSEAVHYRSLDRSQF